MSDVPLTRGHPKQRIGMKKSKRETVDTKRRIIAAASTLFLEKGFCDVGIAEVMAAVGLTTGGFYRHFESKDELIAEANRAANEKLFGFYDSAVVGLGPLEAMEAIVDLYLDQTQNNESPDLCPLANLGSELRHTSDHIREVAMEGHQRWVGALAAFAAELEIPYYARVADAIVSTIVGAVTLSQLAVDPVIADAILNNARATVHTMLLNSVTESEAVEEAV
jgi:TetR/AcrR family transcriptional repressor of nem operon